MPFDKIDIHVGSRLRESRRARRMSMQTLGVAIGAAFQQCQKYETGANRISNWQLWRISRTLDVPVTAFFPGLDMPDVDFVPAARIARFQPPARTALFCLIEAIARSSCTARR